MEQFLELSVSPLIPSLPDDVALDIVARVPRSHYPTLSLVSKKFRNLIASPKLYKRRSQLGITQHRVYAILRNRNNTDDCRLYILHRKLNCSNRLVVVRSLPPVSHRGSFVSVGSKVYVFNDVDALCVDCTSHTVQPIPDMPQRFAATPMPSRVGTVMDGKVYLIGDSRFTWDRGMAWRKTVMVLDAETQVWEPVMGKEDMRVGAIWSDAVVMEDKICMRGVRDTFSVVYGPKENTWESNEVLNSKNWEGKALRAFDPKQSRWSVVNGLEEFLAVETAQSKWPIAVKCGEKKLALFFPKKHDGKEVICCAEIALERRQGGGIWGKLESCDVVVEDGLFDVMKCVSVTVPQERPLSHRLGRDGSEDQRYSNASLSLQEAPPTRFSSRAAKHSEVSTYRAQKVDYNQQRQEPRGSYSTKWDNNRWEGSRQHNNLSDRIIRRREDNSKITRNGGGRFRPGPYDRSRSLMWKEKIKIPEIALGSQFGSDKGAREETRMDLK
ncbi:F-box/kelch-repeat protein-like [Raphanus sativus]|nr:F-box/kelch-repeat protein-like [Raphanus sativus]